MPAAAAAANAGQNKPATLVGDREIMTVRTFDAPRELVFKVWTDPTHIAKWWGPNGFSITTSWMDVRPGGTWRFVMHGPDGRDYINKVTYKEFVPPERIVFQHGGDEDAEPVSHTTEVTFKDLGGNRTELTMRLICTSAERRDFVIRNYHADQGLNQTIGRLAEYVVSGDAQAPAVRPFVVSRTFDAPREKVWKAWTSRDELMKWFGPKGFTMTRADLDFRPGGVFHYCLKSPQGAEMWGKFTYREIVAPARIVLVNSFSDAAGGITRHPMAPTWPREMLSTSTFTETGGTTTLTIMSAPLNATPEEIATFDAARDGMAGGWTGTFEQLTEHLKRS